MDEFLKEVMLEIMTLVRMESMINEIHDKDPSQGSSFGGLALPTTNN